MNKNLKKLIGAGIILFAIIVLGTTIINAVFSDTNPLDYVASSIGLKKTSADTVAHPPSPIDPYRLEIPSLNINAGVQYVGIKTSGELGTPSNFTDVAWYKDGPAPGQAGTAVIDGHVDNGLALAGVFKHLENLSIGDSVYVVDNAGKKFEFVVTNIKTYSYNTPGSNDIFASADDASHLNLITCTGDWIALDKTYNERLVVYTTLVS